MSEEIGRIIKECSCVDTFDYVITPQQRDTMRLAEYIKELQQENQQLKEALDKATKQSVIDHKYASECEDRVITYKSVLDEIREYVNRQEVNSIGSFFADTPIGKDLLQILDKVKE